MRIATPMLAATASSLDHLDVDHHQDGEADGIGQQRGQPRQEQAAERVARGDQFVRAAPDVLHDAVHLLRAVGMPMAKMRNGTRIE